MQGTPKIKIYGDVNQSLTKAILTIVHMSALKSDQYEYHNIEVARGDNLSKDYLDLNPLGTVPALLDTSSDTLVIDTHSMCS